MPPSRPALPISRSMPASRIEHDPGGGRQVLRPFWIPDLLELRRALEASRVELRRFSPWAHLPGALEPDADKIKRTFVDYLSGTSFELGLFDGGDGLLSSINLERHSSNPDCFVLSFWTPTYHAGRGYGTCAVRIAVVYAFEHLGAIRVEVSHDSRNPASHRVIEKCGFVFEGRMRNLTRVISIPERSDYEAEGTGLGYALIPADREVLEWYATMRASLRFFDITGAPG